MKVIKWCLRAESNRRHKDFQSFALPTELPRQKLAVWTGLEPATSCVTGRHSNQLNYQTIIWLREKDLNQRPPGYEPDELPDCSIPRYKNGGERGIRTPARLSSPTGFQDRTLQPLGYFSVTKNMNGGPDRTRTCDQPVMSRWL